MMSFLQVFNSKKIIILFLLITFIVSGLSVPSYAEETEQWEKDLTTCINQKKAASIHVSLDVSGSTEFTDPNGVRGAATVAITLGLQKITKEVQSSDYENVDMEISWSTFSSFGNAILPWTNLSTSNLTKQQLDSEKILLNKSDGGTSYLEALYVVDTLFNTKKIQNSCEILIFMTDGTTSDSYSLVLNKIDSFQSRGMYLIGVALDNSSKMCLDVLLGELADNCVLSDGTVEFSNNSIYLKSKVFLAKNATDVLNAFLKISNQLRASGFNQDKEDIDTEQTVICTQDKECFYELSLGVGTQTAIIQMNISDPGNVGDVELYIEPPPALNVSDSLKTLPPGGLSKTQFGDSMVEVEWYSEEVGVIKIDLDPDKNSWVGNWKFKLNAIDPKGRTVEWTTTLFTKLVPKIPSDVPLRIGQESCVDITYLGEAPPTNAEVKLLVIDPSDGSVIKSINADEIPRGHRACITPDQTFPSKVKLQTDIIYEPAKGKKASADVASSKIIEILEAPKNNLITGPINSEKQVFKGDQVVSFEFNIEGGNIDSVLNIDITQLTSNLSPDVNWTVEYKGDKYQLGTDDFPIQISANENEILRLIGDPYEASTQTTDTMYEVTFKSSMPSISAIEDTVAVQINTRFLDVPLIDIIQYALSILFLFLFVGFLTSYIYSSINSGLVFDKNIRTKTYPIRLDSEGIDWIGDNFYNDTFDNTRVLKTSPKKVLIGSSIKIQFKQKLFPFVQDSSAEISSKNLFTTIFNKKLLNSDSIKTDINKIWIFEVDSSNDDKVVGSLTIIANNEQTFNLLKDSITDLNKINFSNIPEDIPTSESNESSISNGQSKDEKTSSPPSGPGGPPSSPPSGPGGPPSSPPSGPGGPPPSVF